MSESPSRIGQMGDTQQQHQQHQQQEQQQQERAVEKRVSYPGGESFSFAGTGRNSKYKSLSKRGRSQSANRGAQSSSAMSHESEEELEAGKFNVNFARRNSASDPASAGLLAAAAVAAAAAATGTAPEADTATAESKSSESEMKIEANFAESRGSSISDQMGREHGVRGSLASPVDSIAMESISGHDLIDTSRLAGCLRRTSTRIDHHGARLDRVEKLIHQFPADYVTSEQVAESTDRMDLLAQKISGLLDEAERTQRVEMAKLSGEITNVVASIGSLESSLIRLESTQKSLVRSLDDMQRQIGQRATVDDLRTLRTQVATCAAKEDLARVEEQVGQCARRQELDDVLSTMQAGFTNKKTDQQLSVLKESFSAQIGIVQQSMVKLASKAEVAEVQRATGEAVKSAKGADEAVNDLKRSLEELAQRFSAMDASLDERHKGEDENGQRVDAEAFSEITTRITAAESTCSRLADQVDAVSDSVSLNTRTMRTQATMLQEVTEEVNKKLSTEDWEQIESEIDRVYATKEQVAESVEPIVTKLNQVVAKLIDLDKDITAKADGQTVVENREHIQDLFRVIHDQVSRLGATDAAPSGTSASAADAGSAMTATKESSVPLPAAAAAAALAARMPEAVSSPMPKSLENADASQKGSTKMKALQQEMKNQAKEIQNIRKALATTKHADATNTSASAALESQFAERLDAQEKDLLQLRASIEELRNIFTLSGDTAREQMALAERPVITTVRTELGEVPRMPSRPEGSAPLTAPSPRAQSINSTSSDKKLEVSP